MPKDLTFYIAQLHGAVVFQAAQTAQHLDAVQEELTAVKAELAALKAKTAEVIPAPV